MELTEFLSKIYSVEFPEHWKDEGVERPNMISKNNAMYITMILDKCDITLDRVDCTKENGLYLVKDYDNKSLIFETYNDGNVATIITDNLKKVILYNEDIKEFNFSKVISYWKYILNEN